jgi:hypothetical protein
VTDAVVSGALRETLLAADGELHVAGMMREVLRSTGTGAGTFIAVDGMIREALLIPPSTGQQRVMVMA